MYLNIGFIIELTSINDSISPASGLAPKPSATSLGCLLPKARASVVCSLLFPPCLRYMGVGAREIPLTFERGQENESVHGEWVGVSD